MAWGDSSYMYRTRHALQTEQVGVGMWSDEGSLKIQHYTRFLYEFE